MREFLVTGGGSERLEGLQSDETRQAVAQLSGVHGIGPKTARTLVKQHGLATVEELRVKVAR
jgi:Holliday junction resolvasome RuvABC DNA-binding subunit